MVPDFNPGDFTPDFFHNPCTFVPQNNGKANVRPFAFDDMPIGMADTTGHQAHAHLIRTRIG